MFDAVALLFDRCSVLEVLDERLIVEIVPIVDLKFFVEGLHLLSYGILRCSIDELVL
jgi:hypothetical protein